MTIPGRCIMGIANLQIGGDNDFDYPQFYMLPGSSCCSNMQLMRLRVSKYSFLSLSSLCYYPSISFVLLPSPLQAACERMLACIGFHRQLNATQLRLKWGFWRDFGNCIQPHTHTHIDTHWDTWAARWGARMPVKSACYLHIITLCGRIRVCLITWLPPCMPVCVYVCVWGCLAAHKPLPACIWVCMCMCVGECKCGQTFPGHQTETLDKSVWQIYKSIKFCGQQCQSQRIEGGCDAKLGRN